MPFIIRNFVIISYYLLIFFVGLESILNGKFFCFWIQNFDKIREVTNLIRRVSDEIFDDKAFTRIAETMHKNSRKLFSVVNSETEAQKIQKDLNVNGYQSSYEKKGEYYNVYYSPTVPKFKVDESILKQFENIGNNQYRAFEKPSKIAGLYDYNFDDGSIWTLKTYEDGQQYLVKEVQDDDEDTVIRKKATKAGLQKDVFTNKLNEILKKNHIVVTSKLLSEIKNQVLADMLDDVSVQKKITSFATKEISK